MGWLSQRASKRVLACLAVLGVGGIVGLLAGFSADADQTAELSPAEVVAMRFPGGSSRVAFNQVAPAPAEAESSPAPAGYVLASVTEADPQAFNPTQASGLTQVSGLMFNPFPTYSLSASASPLRSAPPQQLATASVEIPAGALALAYAAPGLDEPATPAARLESASAAPAAIKRSIQPPPRPASPNTASQGPASPSNAVLNNAQIASIRERLKLTSYQNQLWPPVESALRDISWHNNDAGGRKVANAVTNPHGGTIDPNSVPVQRLKSAAFPLIMSLSDDQKQEVRTMVRLMGLENLASQF